MGGVGRAGGHVANILFEDGGRRLVVIRESFPQQREWQEALEPFAVNATMVDHSTLEDNFHFSDHRP